MIDLGQLEQRLKTDPTYRDEFMREPVKELAKLGIVLSNEQARFLRDSIAGRVSTMPDRPRSGIIAVLIGL
jgi:hypothetical protein